MTARFVDAAPDAPARPPLDAAVAHAAVALRARGVEPGDRVLLSCEPSVDTVVAYLAVRRAGAVVVPASTLYTRRELEHVCGDVRPVLAIVTDPARVEGLVPASVGPDELAAGAAASPAPPAGALTGDGDPDRPAMIAFTSGTTGAPKGAVLSAGNLDASAAAVVEAWRWTADDVLVLALPLFHMHGLGVGVNGTVAAGATAVVLPRFDAGAVVDAVRDHGATMFFGVPTMYARLVEHPRAAELRSLRLMVSGSAPLAPDLWRRVRDFTGHEVLERYGMSETVMLTSNPYDGPRKPGTVGVPLPRVEVRLADDGGVQVRGPNVFRGYWERPQASAEAFTDDGWFRTGDVGELDEDGYLRLVGRSSELIITGGYNVYPREVEEVVRTHPLVADVAVVGVPDPVWGERVVGFVVPAGERVPSDDELDAHARGLLADYKRPRRWLVVDALPRNAMGKVRRDVLRAEAAGATA